MKGTVNTNLRKPVLAAILVVATGLIGCSNTADMQSLRSQIETAAADALAAKSDAAEAKATAQSAYNTAESAKAAADAANATSQATEAKIDRMFKKAMYK